MKAVKRKISPEETLASTQPTKKPKWIEDLIGIKIRGTSMKPKNENETFRRPVGGPRRNALRDENNSSKTSISSDANNGTRKRSHEKTVEPESAPTEQKKKRPRKLYSSEPRELRPRTKKVSYKPEKLSKTPKNPVETGEEEFEILSSSCTKITAEERGQAFFIIPEKKRSYSNHASLRVI